LGANAHWICHVVSPDIFKLAAAAAECDFDFFLREESFTVVGDCDGVHV
jgi:hypothetical protein